MAAGRPDEKWQPPLLTLTRRRHPKCLNESAAGTRRAKRDGGGQGSLISIIGEGEGNESLGLPPAVEGSPAGEAHSPATLPCPRLGPARKKRPLAIVLVQV